MTIPTNREVPLVPGQPTHSPQPRPLDVEHAMSQLFAAHHAQVVAYAARRTRPPGDRASAEDVASETFAIAWRRCETDGVDALPTLPWLLVTARNVLRQHQRDDARRLAREDRVAHDRSGPPLEAGELAGVVEQVTRALDVLREEDRELLLLRVWDELAFADIAAVLGCSTGAARVRWLRARRRFAAALTAADRPDPTAQDVRPTQPEAVTVQGGPA